jgi:hypothetical protein
MREVGSVLRAERVAAIYLVHGSFDGPQMYGVLAALARAVPEIAAEVRRAVRHLVERPAAEAAHFTDRYAWTLESALHAPGERCIPVHSFHWSGENHHLGRADAAVRLIDELASLRLDQGERVLLWGHGHAGNAFALMTNLLAGHPAAVERFFRSAEVYYRWPVLGLIDIPVWQRVFERLASDRPPLEGVAVDLVTFGTPIRYGWDTDGYSRLLHFVHHRPTRGLPMHRAAWPLDPEDVLSGADGDRIQQLAIAGTNTPPAPFAWRAWLADRRLEQLLEADLADSAEARYAAGTIVPQEGTTLLVDYRESEALGHRHAGHGVYTHKRWLLFHAEQVAQQFYAAQACKAA